MNSCSRYSNTFLQFLQLQNGIEEFCTFQFESLVNPLFLLWNKLIRIVGDAHLLRTCGFPNKYKFVLSKNINVG